MNDKNLVREIKVAAKVQANINKETVAAAFDLQKALLTPYGQTSPFYYSRRLANYNFTVTQIQNMSTSCYFWSESECNKGSCQVATALKSYLVKRRSEGINISICLVIIVVVRTITEWFLLCFCMFLTTLILIQ